MNGASLRRRAQLDGRRLHFGRSTDVDKLQSMGDEERSASINVKARVGLRGVQALDPKRAAVLGELRLQLIEALIEGEGEQCVRPARREFSEREWRLLFRTSSESDQLRLLWPPIKLPSRSELPEFEPRPAESNERPAIDRRTKRGDSSQATFQPLFGIDDSGNPVERNDLMSDRECSVCDMAWHPYRCEITIALVNDCLYSYDLESQIWSKRVLRHSLQRDIKRIAWQPIGGSTLAVATRNGICSWKIVGNDAWMTLLAPYESSSSNSAVDLAFSPCGQWLASCHQTSHLCVWDSLTVNRGLVRLPAIGMSLSIVQWSPNGSYVAAAGLNSNKFIVWDTKRWQAGRWINASAPSRCLQWHSSESILLHCETESSLVSCVRIDDSFAKSLLDLGTDDNSDSMSGLGGRVDRFCWSPSGKRLVVSFLASEEGASLLALFAVNTREGELPTFMPIGYIHGPTKGAVSHQPKHFSFRPRFDYGELLAVMWMNGEICFYPLLFELHA